MRAHAAASGTSGSGVVEGLLRGFFEMPERDQKAAVEAIPQYERKTAANGFRDPVAPPNAERVTVMTTPELGPKAAWVEKGPADRVQVIKDAQVAKVAFEKKPEVEPQKKEGVILGDMASKIFTF